MLIRILKGLAVLVLVLASVYGLLLYLTRIDFKPVPLAGPSKSLRVGEWLMDIPQPLEVQRYVVELGIGGKLLHLSENLEAPVAASEEGLADVMAKLPDRAGDDTGWVAIADLSRDLGRAASMEVKLQPLNPNGRAPRELLVRATIPQPVGYLSISYWLKLPDGLYGNWDQLAVFLKEAQPSFVDQVQTVLSHYRWIGPDISEKPYGFMTRYGLLEPPPGSFQVFAIVELSFAGEATDIFSYFITVWPQLKSEAYSDPAPPFWEKMRLLFKSLTHSPTRFHTQFRRMGGRPGYETVIFSYNRVMDYSPFMLMEWSPAPETNEPGTAAMAHYFMADGFDQARAPEYFTLWRHVLDSAR